ncbi:hypothetical protein KCU93_g234, partial [Aureobasidium melanogenum]
MRQEGATAQQLDSLFVRAACHLDRSCPTSPFLLPKSTQSELELVFVDDVVDSVIVEGLLGMVTNGSYRQAVSELPLSSQSSSTYLIPLSNILAIDPDQVIDPLLITTTGPDIFNTSIIIVGVLETFWTDQYRIWVELGNEVDVSIKAVTIFKPDLPL